MPSLLRPHGRRPVARSVTEGVLQLTNEIMTAGELEGISGEPGVLYDDNVDVAYTDNTSGTSIFALGRQLEVPGCWRCGSSGHLRRDCPLPASKAELEGAPMNRWAKMPPRVAPSVARRCIRR